MHVSTNGGYGMNHIYKVVWSKVRNAYVVGCTCQQKLDTKLKKLGIKIEYLYKIQ